MKFVCLGECLSLPSRGRDLRIICSVSVDGSLRHNSLLRDFGVDGREFVCRVSADELDTAEADLCLWVVQEFLAESRSPLFLLRVRFELVVRSTRTDVNCDPSCPLRSERTRRAGCWASRPKRRHAIFRGIIPRETMYDNRFCASCVSLPILRTLTAKVGEGAQKVEESLLSPDQIAIRWTMQLDRAYLRGSFHFRLAVVVRLRRRTMPRGLASMDGCRSW